MALIQKTNPVGLDHRINQFQPFLYKKLNLSDYESLPRVYLNETEIEGKKGLIPEYFEGNKEYQDILFNDNHAATSFFFRMPVDSTHENGVETARVALIFQVKLDKLFVDPPHRFDEELNGLVESASIGFFGYSFFKLDNTVQGIRDVYQEFLIDKIRYTNMQHFYVVRFEFIVKFRPNMTC
jgi:hypothetical protein